MVCLIKPQFEAGRDKVGKKGVVRDRSVHEEVVENVTAMAAGLGFDILGLDFSPIRGPEGNIEYLMYIKKREGAEPGDAGALRETQEEKALISAERIKALVQESHEELDRKSV